ncbi:polyprenyl synthetase family protein [Streptomyces sp. NPDC090621]
MPGDDDWGEVRSEIDRLLSDLVDREAESFRRLGLEELPHPVRQHLQGGKRTRALFCYWGWRCAGGQRNAGPATAAGAAMEANHSAFLIHDDIVDRSALRRGRPALYRHFTGVHTENGWFGSANAYGDGAALLLGDIVFAWAGELIAQAATGDTAARVRAAYDRMQQDTGYGQLLEARIQADREFSVERCRTVVLYKAVRYMVTPSLLIGAALAEAPPELTGAYEVFGDALGEAYQMRDDLLGAFGNPLVTGKPNLDDLREGKPTVLFATALEHADLATRTLLLGLYGRPDLDEKDADAIRLILRESGAVEEVEASIASLRDRAERALHEAPLTDMARQRLISLADRAVFRTS